MLILLAGSVTAVTLTEAELFTLAFKTPPSFDTNEAEFGRPSFLFVNSIFFLVANCCTMVATFFLFGFKLFPLEFVIFELDPVDLVLSSVLFFPIFFLVFIQFGPILLKKILLKFGKNFNRKSSKIQIFSLFGGNIIFT